MRKPKHTAAAAFLLALAWPLAVRAGDTPPPRPPPAAASDPRADLESGRSLFTNGKYDEAAKMLAKLLAEPLDPKAPDYKKRHEIAQAARPVYAASLVALGKGADADRVILEQLLDDPWYEPPPGAFPEPVVQHFIQVGSEHADEIEAARKRIIKIRQDEVAHDMGLNDAERKRIQELERLASEETVITTRSRLVALLPYGIGQYQNGSIGLGVFFTVSQVLGTATAATSLGLAGHYAAQGDCIAHREVCDDAHVKYNVVRTINWVSFGVTGALMLAGIVEAEVTLVPERKTIRKRPIPPPVKVEPTGGAGPQGVTLGLRVLF